MARRPLLRVYWSGDAVVDQQSINPQILRKVCQLISLLSGIVIVGLIAGGNV